MLQVGCPTADVVVSPGMCCSHDLVMLCFCICNREVRQVATGCGKGQGRFLPSDSAHLLELEPAVCLFLNTKQRIPVITFCVQLINELRQALLAR